MNSFRSKLAMPLCAIALAIAFGAHASDYDDVERLTQSGKLDEAMTRADQFLSNNPRDSQMRFLKGLVQIDLGKTNDAIATFTRLTQDAPELPEPYNNLAVLYAGQGQYDKARATLESAIRTNPSYSTAHENLGDVYARLASQAYSKALQLDQSNTAIAPKLAVIRSIVSPTTPTSPNVARSGGKDKVVVAAAAPTPPVPTPVQAAPAAPSKPPAPAPAAAPTPAPAPAAKAPPPPVVAAAPVPPPPAPAKPPAPAIAAAPAVPTSPAAAPEKPAASASTGEIESAVRAWASAWASQDMDAYLGAYGSGFKPAGGQSRKAWEEERRARIVGKSNISVSAQNLVVTVNGDTATAKFRQSYRADTLNVNSRKTLEMVRHGGGWKIVKETVGG